MQKRRRSETVKLKHLQSCHFAYPVVEQLELGLGTLTERVVSECGGNLVVRTNSQDAQQKHKKRKAQELLKLDNPIKT